MYKNIEALDYVFSDGDVAIENQNIVLKKIDMGGLFLESGEIVANDPFVLFELDPFNVTVPSGTYAVSIFIAELFLPSKPEPVDPQEPLETKDSAPADVANDKRVALACLKLSDKKAVRWEAALTGKENNSGDLESDAFFGYGVDSGTGGFMDKTVADKLSSLEIDIYDEVAVEMDKTYEHTYCYILTDATKCGRNDFAAFSSGYGDGAYPSYFGFDEDGKPCVLVTDFLVLEEQKES